MAKKVRTDLRVGGNVTGQVAVGDHNSLVNVQAGATDPLTADERARLDALIAELRAQISAEAPDARQADAAARVDELAEQMAGGPPDVGALKRVVRWFRDEVPQLAGALRRLVVSPLVARLVATAGDVAAEEFHQFLGDIAR